MAEGQLKRYRIKDKSGNTKDVTYDPECGLTPQEFLTKEIAKFNQEKEDVAKNELAVESTKPIVGLDEKKQVYESEAPKQSFSEQRYQEPEHTELKKDEEPVQEDAKASKPNKSLASIMASKSGISLSSIAAKRNANSKKNDKKKKGISRDSYVPNDRLVTTGVKKS